MVLVIGLGTIIDWAVHSSHQSLYVEPEYYTGKLIFGTIWALVGLWLLKNVVHMQNPKHLAIGVPAFVALFLQTKYFYQGRDNFFVFLFLFLHFLMFLPFSFWVFKKFPGILVGDTSTSGSTSTRWSALLGIILVMEVLFYLYFTYYVGLQRF